MRFPDIQHVYQFLDSLPSFQRQGADAARLELDRILLFCSIMGHPEKSVPCIHVAGTNGKGSVCAMLALAYEEAGYRCGLFTSPHLEHISERFRVNGQNISEADLLRFFQCYGEEIQEVGLSYFEITAALAFWWFAWKEVEMAILETGLGGRLDATNVVTPEVAVITSIGLDHQNFLGNTLSEIAREKGGIIKPGVPVVLGNMPDEARLTLEAIAAERHAPIWDVRSMKPRMSSSMESHQNRKMQTCTVDAGGSSDDKLSWISYGFLEDGKWVEMNSDLAAPVHCWNIAAARMAAITAAERFPVTITAFSRAISRVGKSDMMKARFERLHPEYQWFFDAAHNDQAVEALINTISGQEWQDGPVMIMSIMRDKVQKKMLEPFSVFEKNYYYELQTERAADITVIAPYVANIKNLPSNEEEIIEFFKGFTKQVVIFTGSFYFYGVVKRWISRIIKS